MAGLRVLPVSYADGSQCLVSAWLPTPEEMAALKEGKPIYLGVLSARQPPVSLTTNIEDFGGVDSEGA